MDTQELGQRHEPFVVEALAALWGKSRERAGGTTSLLMAHLLDTAAVAEMVWEHYLARSTQAALDEVAGGTGRGRTFFVWLCGIHDCGKATPAHQRLWAEGAEAVRRTGLSWLETAAVAGAKKHGRWRHDWAGGLVARELLAASGWDARQVDWLWPLVAGHHGAFPSLRDVQEPGPAKGQLRGRGKWRQVQEAVLDEFTREVGFASLHEVEPAQVPTRALQLQLSGLVVMADWIASDERYFVGVDDLASVSLDASRKRAGAAWEALGMQGGWRSLGVPGPEAFQDRFGCAPRPSQAMAIDVARQLGAPGLMVIEAPMGEGKTEAALAAAEVLAARFGADGVFVGMPTQATSDPMFTRVRRWVETIESRLALRVMLLHGKRAFNQEWKAMRDGAQAQADQPFRGVDEFGLDDDPYGVEADPACSGSERQALSEWFLGPKRGLLAPFVVGTVDQLLYAATRTRHVMLRMAGLAGKVVVLDEVHACDVYMSQFLQEALRWLGQARVPVVLLSATLAPAQRQTLFEAYLAGAASREELDVKVPAPPGYPSVTAAWISPAGETRFHSQATDSWRADLEVVVRTVPEAVPGAGASRAKRERAQAQAEASVGDLLASELADGGTALVIRNSVARAQSLYAELRGRFGPHEVRLLHARFTVAHRAELTEESLRLLGPHTPRQPGARLILVATQLAEQSFDVDADLLITDLAPVDLLLQRIGRVHRHQTTRRPHRLRTPQVFVTGFQPRASREPSLAYASEKIYGRHLLLRTAALLPKEGAAWSVPGDVPHLVAQAYENDTSLLPEAWRPAGTTAMREQETQNRARAEHARQFLLTARGERELPTLAGLHYGGMSAASDENSLRAAVRDGDESIEVALVLKDGPDAGYRTLSGRPLGANGDVALEVLDDVLGSVVRLPPHLTQAAAALKPLPGWYGHPWLRGTAALVLDSSGRTALGDVEVSYDVEFGLRTMRRAGAAAR
ncbi:CRISPR-associated helicase Cas3' [Streptomyces mesophilus]|uniref:CRISPR-associated helicase Cas3' n=1 Tax=Streptomyces mesophilus TaxID=1775132 RepID=UPI002E2870A3|nr:CRISPR-associated helicase Cas3' [Streptomyces mesophilus]